ncbi:unnamed protein product [Coregonus sp. 'balchen']|nr:unnamed protein product [Coregonus sp. 'balchen']
MSTLWMGNLEPYMDEKFITRAFGTMGELVVSVRIIRNKMTGRFKLNRATFGKQGESGPLYSLFVGDLTPEVDDGMLYEFFYNRYPSCRGGKVVLDGTGNSKGCGFVQFPDQRLQKLALEECQGAVGLGSKALRLSLAANKTRHNQSDNRGWGSHGGGYRHNHNQYNQQPYGGGWGSWGYDQNGGNYDGYNYNQYDYTQNPVQENEADEDDGLEELDVVEANRKFMEHSEELYDALIECHWQPLESSEQAFGTTSSLPEPVYC